MLKKYHNSSEQNCHGDNFLQGGPNIRNLDQSESDQIPMMIKKKLFQGGIFKD